MKIKPLLTGVAAVLFCVMLIFIFNKPVIPIAIGMLVGLVVFLSGYALGFC